MKRCPTCNRTYMKEDQKFCPQDGTRLDEIEEVEFDPLKTIVATPKPVAAEDAAPPTPAPTPPPPPEPARQEEKPAEFDPFQTMVATPAPSTSGVESPSLQAEESAPVEKKMDAPAPPPAREESFDPFQTMLATPAPKISEPLEPPPSAASSSFSSSAFDEERTIDRAPSESLHEEATPASAFAEPLTSQYAPVESSAPMQTPEPPQTTDWGANQQPAEYAQQQYPSAPLPQAVPQEKKRKGAARISMILGILSLLLVALSGLIGLTRGIAAAIIYPMLKITGGTMPIGIIVRYVIMLVMFGLPFIGLILGLYGLIKAWKQPAKFGGKGMALTGVLTNVLSEVIFFLSLAYLVWTLMVMFQRVM